MILLGKCKRGLNIMGEKRMEKGNLTTAGTAYSYVYMTFTFKCQCNTFHLVYTSNSLLSVSSGNHLHLSSQQYAVTFFWAFPPLHLGVILTGDAGLGFCPL